MTKKSASYKPTQRFAEDQFEVVSMRRKLRVYQKNNSTESYQSFVIVINKMIIDKKSSFQNTTTNEKIIVYKVAARMMTCR